MKPEEIKTIQDLISFLGEEKTEELFQEYLIEVTGEKNKNTEALFEY